MDESNINTIQINIDEKIRHIKVQLEYDIDNNNSEIEDLNRYYIYRDNDNEIIDGVNGLNLFNNISLFGSRPKNILFLNDSHEFNKTYKDTDIYISRYNIYNNMKKEIYSLNISNEDTLRYIRELTNFINDKLYKKITVDLFNNEIISVDELLYYITTNTKECYDIFIENRILDLENITNYGSFMILTDNIFFNCGNKLIYNQAESNIINDANIENRICNFNSRYHRADIRNLLIHTDIVNVYYVDKSSDSIYIDDTLFYEIVDLYLNFLFKEGNDEKEKNLFLNKNLKHLSKSNTRYNIKNLFEFYEKSKKDIIKQYNKSIFKTKITINKLKKIIKLVTLPEKFIKEIGFSPQSKYYDFLNLELTSLIMNLYSLFRMFIDDWHIDSSKKTRVNLSDSCNNLNYPKNIIFFAGGAHNHWLINFINKCMSDIYDMSDMSIYSHDKNNYLSLDTDKFLKLKEYLTLINTTQEYLDCEKEMNYTSIEEFYNYNDIYLRLLNKYIEYNIIESINFIIDFNELTDFNTKLNKKSKLSDDDLNILNDYLNNIQIITNKIYKLSNSNIYNYYRLLFINIKNLFIINNVINDKVNDDYVVINDIDNDYFINTDIIDYDNLLIYYNELNNLNVFLSSPHNILEYLLYNNYKLDNKLIRNLEYQFSNILKLQIFLYDLYKYLLNNIQESLTDLKGINNYKSLKNYSLDDILIILYKLIKNICSIFHDDITDYFYNNLVIYVNNLILLICFENKSEDLSFYCKKENSINKKEIHKYFYIGLDINKLYEPSNNIIKFFREKYNILIIDINQDILYYEDNIEKYKSSIEIDMDILTNIDEHLTKLHNYLDNVYIYINDDLKYKINNTILILCYIYDNLSNDKSDLIKFTPKCNGSDDMHINIPFDTMYEYYKNNEDISLLYNDEEYIEDEDDLSDIIKSNKLQKYLDI